ncbi:high affinity copper uptake protein 1-like [Anneissia japonica]|uniref:high affinity copper uptake protein 1-like n=1 Tax=Anneissia japonica TaxID=1529436 RepID=UPI001425B6D4|nr:high affinity copper uptake protein 1-like [Anneissia japonica]
MYAMYFHFNSTVENFLFKGWEATGSVEFIFTCLFVFTLAFIYELFIVYRDLCLHKNVQQRCEENAIDLPSPSEKSRILGEAHGEEEIGLLTSAHICQTIAYVVFVAVRYILMLVVMTFNGYLCLSLLAGSSLGYFLFAWKKITIVGLQPNN